MARLLIKRRVKAVARDYPSVVTSAPGPVVVCCMLHTHIHTYSHTYIHTHIHTYIHTYIHTHIHTLGQAKLRAGKGVDGPFALVSWSRIDFAPIGIMGGVAGVRVGDSGGCGLESWRDGRGGGFLGSMRSRALRRGDGWLCN